jgi:hypothetical protein
LAAPNRLAATFTCGSHTDDDDAVTKEPSIVGLWKQHLISEGSDGIKNGTEVDASYVQ